MECESIENKRSCFGTSDVPKLVTSPNGENKAKLTGPFGVCCRVPTILQLLLSYLAYEYKRGWS